MPKEYFSLESRRYIGCKAKLIDWIMDTIREVAPEAHSFCDIFAGTGVVAERALAMYDRVILNDFLFSNNTIYNAFFAPGDWNTDKLWDIVEEYNEIDAKQLPENYFSLNYGGKFYEQNIAKLIGHIRQDIEDRRNELTEKEYNILIASLIYTIDRLANTLGHFEAFIRKPIVSKPFKMRLIDAKNFDGVEIYREDSNHLARQIASDVVYIDPPYNSRQYCRFYHLYETLVKWDFPVLKGAAMKPPKENMSDYCTTKAITAFSDLIEHLNTRYIVVSYNNTYKSKSSSSENRISLKDIQQILERRGETMVYQHGHKFFNAGKTDFNDHKEFLFVTEVHER